MFDTLEMSLTVLEQFSWSGTCRRRTARGQVRAAGRRDVRHASGQRERQDEEGVAYTYIESRERILVLAPLLRPVKPAKCQVLPTARVSVGGGVFCLEASRYRATDPTGTISSSGADPPIAAHTLYNLIDRRHGRVSTAVISNIALGE
jgi:hypothetical protein